MSSDTGGTALWGGRFATGLDPEILEFTGSLSFDARLVRHDLIASLAHARMLLETQIVGREDAEAILDGLAGLLSEIEEGSLTVTGPDEDIHTWIERTLHERIGPAAGRLHTARSRNDQVSAAMRLYVIEATDGLTELAASLLGRWHSKAKQHVDSWMPGYTHLQRAQPVSLAHHLLAHFWAVEADVRRLQTVRERASVSPLGAAALAGTRHPIDPHRTAELLGLRRVYANSLFAVADRDFVVEAVFACALLVLHLGRWAEEIVLWTSSEFGFAELADSLAQGSSLMPQKKNPEAAELLRGKGGRLIGDLTGLLAVLKGLPFSYNSDLQEDKEPLFDAFDTAGAGLSAAERLANGIRFDIARMRAALDSGFVTATDLADILAQRGLPFREAHRLAGLAVREAEERGCQLWELDPDVATLPPEIDAEVLGATRPDRAGGGRVSFGSPAPEQVERQLELAAESLEGVRETLGSHVSPPIYRAYRAGGLRNEELS
jgi:argininosuccinate lyase